MGKCGLDPSINICVQHGVFGEGQNRTAGELAAVSPAFSEGCLSQVKGEKP